MARLAATTPMTTAVAIFVKTPGLSPVKTRLAASIGVDAAERFHWLAAAAVAGVVRDVGDVGDVIVPYWAVAESGEAARRSWLGFPVIEQGGGGFAARLHKVYDSLLARHEQVLLIGADAPQLTAQLIGRAIAALREQAHEFVLGEAHDGGFWLFGGRHIVTLEQWLAVAYSCADTAALLRRQLLTLGRIAALPQLGDADTLEDLVALRRELATLPTPVAPQQRLAEWLARLLARHEPVPGNTANTHHVPQGGIA